MNDDKLQGAEARLDVIAPALLPMPVLPLRAADREPAPGAIAGGDLPCSAGVDWERHDA